MSLLGRAKSDDAGQTVRGGSVRRNRESDRQTNDRQTGSRQPIHSVFSVPHFPRLTLRPVLTRMVLIAIVRTTIVREPSTDSLRHSAADRDHQATRNPSTF